MKTIQHDIYLVECRECGSKYEAPYPPQVEEFGIYCRYCYAEDKEDEKVVILKKTVRVDELEED